MHACMVAVAIELIKRKRAGDVGGGVGGGQG